MRYLIQESDKRRSVVMAANAYKDYHYASKEEIYNM